MNLFDFLVVAVLVAGVMAGRRHGITNELPRLLKWLVLVAFCAAVYPLVGASLAGLGMLNPFLSNLLGYLACALVVFAFFSMLKRRLEGRFEKSDAFGRAEYYLGMGSGFVRYGCVVVTALALLNAREFTPAELRAQQRFQEQNFGSTVFPTLHNIQVSVFQRSLTGSFINEYFGFLLIAPTHPQSPPPWPPLAARTGAP